MKKKSVFACNRKKVDNRCKDRAEQLLSKGRHSKAAVWGSNSEVLIEFSTTEAGTISAKELYKMAYQIVFDQEVKERIVLLEKEIAAVMTLSR